mmetsp:Transcript_14705/g.31903  ORF Transcript_14705/g.31903 Transcript_14705/m.31903 type:complete len:271 (+) Transcript_14705:182-994(+)
MDEEMVSIAAPPSTPTYIDTHSHNSSERRSVSPSRVPAHAPGQLHSVRRALLGRLRPPRWLGHDDLVNAQHCHRRLGCKLYGLRLRHEQVLNALVGGGALDDVDANAAVPRLVRRIHCGDNVRRVEPRVLGEGAWHNLQGQTELVDRILIKAGLGLAVLLQYVGQPELGRAGAGHEARIPDHRLDDVHTVIDGALNIIHDVHAGAANNNGRHLGVVRLVVKDGTHCRSNLLDVHMLAVAQVLRRWRLKTHKVACARRATQPTQLKLARYL